MEEVIYQLSKLVPYFILFPILSMILFIVFTILSKKNVRPSSAFTYGLLMNFGNREIFLLSILLLKNILEVESVFVVNFSVYSLILLFLPIVIFDLLNMDFLKMPVDIIESFFIILLLFFKNIFYSYYIEVNSVWYVLTLFIVMSVFIIIFSIYKLVGNFNRMIIKKEKDIILNNV